MKKIILAAAVSGAMAFSFAPAAQAQPVIDLAAIEAQCLAVPASCAGLLTAALAQAGGNTALIGQLAAIAVATASSNPQAQVISSLSAWLTRASQTVAAIDPAQADALAFVASEVGAGRASTIDTTIIAGSPN